MVSFAMASNLGLRFFHRQVLLDNGELLNRRDRDPGMTAVRFFESEPFDQKAVAGVTGTRLVLRVVDDSFDRKTPIWIAHTIASLTLNARVFPATALDVASFLTSVHVSSAVRAQVLSSSDALLSSVASFSSSKTGRAFWRWNSLLTFRALARSFS